MIAVIKPVCKSLMILKPIIPESKSVRIFKEVMVKIPIMCEGVSYGYYEKKIKIYNDPKP